MVPPHLVVATGDFPPHHHHLAVYNQKGTHPRNKIHLADQKLSVNSHSGVEIRQIFRCLGVLDFGFFVPPGIEARVLQKDSRNSLF